MNCDIYEKMLVAIILFGIFGVFFSMSLLALAQESKISQLKKREAEEQSLIGKDQG
jgi:hypothetical protein